MNGANARDPNFILNECRNIDHAIDDVENDIRKIMSVQSRSLSETDTSNDSPTNRELRSLSEAAVLKFASLKERVQTLRQNPESGNPRNAPQVGKVNRRLLATLNQYQRMESDHSKRMKDQSRRQIRIVSPDASDAEIEEAVNDTSNMQIFSQTVCFVILEPLWMINEIFAAAQRPKRPSGFRA